MGDPGLAQALQSHHSLQKEEQRLYLGGLELVSQPLLVLHSAEAEGRCMYLDRESDTRIERGLSHDQIWKDGGFGGLCQWFCNSIRECGGEGPSRGSCQHCLAWVKLLWICYRRMYSGKREGCTFKPPYLAPQRMRGGTKMPKDTATMRLIGSL